VPVPTSSTSTISPKANSARINQADAYYAGLVRSFGLLADFPNIGQPIDELALGYRRFRFQSHLIFYTVQPDYVEIRAIVHSVQDIRPRLFE
jgi:toxin ParE1/3/4